jgi:hypothetical protein
MLKLRRGPLGSSLVAGSWNEVRGTEGFTGRERVRNGPLGRSSLCVPRVPWAGPGITRTLACVGFWGATNPAGSLGDPLGDPFGGVGGVMISDPQPCFCSGVFGLLLEKLVVGLKRSFSVLKPLIAGLTVFVPRMYWMSRGKAGQQAMYTMAVISASL